jgi:hypothetical protein
LFHLLFLWLANATGDATTFAVGPTNDLSFAVSILAGRADEEAGWLHIGLAEADAKTGFCLIGIVLAQIIDGLVFLPSTCWNTASTGCLKSRATRNINSAPGWPVPFSSFVTNERPTPTRRASSACEMPLPRFILERQYVILFLIIAIPTDTETYDTLKESQQNNQLFCR